MKILTVLTALFILLRQFVEQVFELINNLLYLISNPEFIILLKEARDGDPTAQFNVASMYFYGQRIPQDGRKSIEWYAKAAEQGNTEAQYFLGELYYHGNFVTRNKKRLLNFSLKLLNKGYQKLKPKLLLCTIQGMVYLRTK